MGYHEPQEKTYFGRHYFFSILHRRSMYTVVFTQLLFVQLTLVYSFTLLPFAFIKGVCKSGESASQNKLADLHVLASVLIGSCDSLPASCMQMLII